MTRVPRLWLQMLLLALACALPYAAIAQAEAAKRINVYLDNEVIPLDTHAATVGEFLDELSIELPAEATVDPPPDSALTDGASVMLHGLTVTRGQYEESMPVAFSVEETWGDGPPRVVLQSPGQAGLRVVSCTLFYYQGQEVGRRIRQQVVRAMRPAEVVYFRQLSAEDGPSVEDILRLRLKPSASHLPPKRYKTVLTMESTAYEPGPTSCGIYAGGGTSAGYDPGYGVVAVDPNVIPMHSRLFIEGYGYAVAGDRGGAIDGNEIDLGFLTVDECRQWGRREVKVYILY